VLAANGDLSVKEGPLNAGWTFEAGGVQAFQLAGDRLGVLAANGDLSVKEGPLNAGWTFEAGGVQAFQLSGLPGRPTGRLGHPFSPRLAVLAAVLHLTLR
jgi:hypothetical protein